MAFSAQVRASSRLVFCCRQYLRRSVPVLPLEAGGVAQLPPQVVDVERRHRRHGNRQRNPQLLPLQGDDGAIGLALEELVRQELAVRRLLGRRRDPQLIFGLVVAEAAPRGRVLREDHRPLGRAGDHVEAVAAGRQRLALDGHRMRDGEHGVLVGAGAPRALAVVEGQVVDPVRHQRAEDLAAAVVAVGGVHVGAAIGDRDGDQPDLLGHFTALVVAVGRQGDRLRTGARRECEQGDETESEPAGHGAPPRPHGRTRQPNACRVPGPATGDWMPAGTNHPSRMARRGSAGPVVAGRAEAFRKRECGCRAGERWCAHLTPLDRFTARTDHRAMPHRRVVRRRDRPGAAPLTAS